MRIRWWQSIRWRLAFGSALLALLATSLLALIAVLLINQYYGEDQKSRLGTLVGTIATDKAQAIARIYAQDGKHNLDDSVQLSLNTPDGQNDQQPLIMIFRGNGYPLYTAKVGNVGGAAQATANAQASSFTALTAIARSTATVQASVNPPATTPAEARISAHATAVAQAVITAKVRLNAANARKTLLASTLSFVNPSIQSHDLVTVEQAITKAFEHKHLATDGQIGRDNPTGNIQPFAVRPISDGKHFLGVIVVTTQRQALPPFMSLVGEAVFFVSLIIAMIAALVAIIFSQSITRPLTKLTAATRVLASGDYNAQVNTRAPGELGELAQNFNHMAGQLKQDVEELRQQEVWRRELIMNITHDLATPLTAIAGLGESLMDGVNQSRDDYEATGRIIMHETLRLHRLVQDLHVMAKVEGGALQPRLKPVRLAALCDEVLAVQAPEFERHQIEPINAIPFYLPQVQADPDMLMRVFSNLCNNALRHTPVDGTVTLTASRQEKMLLVTFTDSGEGIPEEALPRIFERFYRADSARQSSTGGSGLGLAIVQAIIEAHGGTVGAKNAPGGGACIFFTLLLSEVEASPVVETKPQPVMSKGLRGTRLIR